MISIICTVYNTKSLLKKCLDSIMSQTFHDVEVILIDDGSTDGSFNILKQYANRDLRVKLIRQDNKGHSEARNVGLTYAKGEYVFFIDSDDCMHPRTLEILYNNLIANDADISIGNVIISRTESMSEMLDAEPNKCRILTPEAALSILIESVKTNYTNEWFVPICATWNKIFKKSLFDNIKFPTGRVHDDNFTAHRLLYAANKIAITSAKTYLYYRHPGSIVTKGIYDGDMVAAIEDRIEFLIENGLDHFLPSTYVRYRQVLRKAYELTKQPEFADKLNSIAELDNEGNPIDILRKYKTVGIYCPKFNIINGVVQWVYNFIQGLKDDYCFIIYTHDASKKVRDRFVNIAQTVVLTDGMTYQCDVLINNTPAITVPPSVTYTKIINVIHCDYDGFLEGAHYKFDPNITHVAVSQVVADNIRQYFGIECKSAEGLFVKDAPLSRRVLHLVSATRFSSQKGFENFIKFAEMLREANILFEWRVYSDSDKGRYDSGLSQSGIVVLPAVDHDALLSYIADADYVVQLSQSEGFGMIVHESLLMKTPVIVSDLPVFAKYVQNGSNGYIVPKDYTKFDINQVLAIPKRIAYSTPFVTLRNKWIRIIERD